MSHDNRNVPSIGKTPSSITSKRSHLIKSRQKSSAKIPTKTLLPKRGIWTNNLTARDQRVTNSASQNEIVKMKNVKSKDYPESIGNKSYDDMNEDDPVTMLRKEIQEWKINELLTSRTEEKLIGTPSEQRSYSYVVSGETTKRQRSPNNVLKTLLTHADLSTVTKNHDVLEYLDLSTDRAVGLPPFCYSRMDSHSQSARDCYCKTRVPITRQREEIHSTRNRVRDSKCSVPKTVRSTKRVPLTPAKIINSEQPDSKGSTVSLPVSPPFLSPETTAAIEDVEKLVKDAQIRLKEISMVTDSGRLKKSSIVYPNETLLDDENDQLLYIRERVAHKFQEANDWIDTSFVGRKSRQFSTKECTTIKPRRTIDLSAPKFKLSDDPYKEYSRQRDIDAAEMTEERGNDEQTCPSKQESEKNKKIDTCSVQMGPSLTIRGELITQNLGNVHISPDPSFVRETQNVATYVVCHDFCRKTESPRRKEKVVKILESDNDAKSMNGKFKKRNGKDRDELDSEEKSDKVLKESGDVLMEENNKKLIQNEEEIIVFKAEEQLVMNVETEENIGTAISVDLDTKCDNEKLEEPTEKSIQNGQEETNKSKIKIVSKSEQKQVRFALQTLETEDPEDHIELQNEGENGVKKSSRLVQELVSPQIPTKDSIEQSNERSPSLNNALHGNVPLSSKEIEETHMINKKRHKEICEERETEKDKRYKCIDQRFTSIVKTYCNLSEEKSNSKNHSCTISSGATSSEEDSDDELYNFYEPSINELDNILAAYDKVIDNVVRSTKTIDKFLLRPEVEEYLVEDTTRTIINRKSLNRPLNRRKVEATTIDNLYHLGRNKEKQDSKWGIKNPPLKKQGFSQMEQIKATVKETSVPLKRNLLVKKDNDCRKKCVASKTVEKIPIRSNLRTKDRLGAYRKFPIEETTESSDNTDEYNTNTGLKEIRQIHPLKRRLIQAGNNGSSLATSSTCPLSSSTDTKTANETKMSEEVSKSQINDDFNGKATNLRLNAMEKEDGKKNNLDCTKLHEHVLKEFLSEVKGAEHLIACVLREETRFIEDKIKNMFDVNEIVSLMVKSLMESLKGAATNTRSLELFIAEDTARNNATSTDIQTAQIVEVEKSEVGSGKQNLRLETVADEEENSNVTERIIEKTISDSRSDKTKNDIVNGQVSGLESQSSEGSNKNVSPSMKENSESGTISKINSDTEFLKENSSMKNVEVDDKRNESEKDNNCASKKDQSLGTKQCGGEYNKDGNSNNISQDANDKIILRDKNIPMEEMNKVLTKLTNEESENLAREDTRALIKTLPLANDALSALRKEKSTVLRSNKNSSNHFSQASSSDSLHDCVSLRSSSKNNTELSQEMNERKQTSETENAVGGRVITMNNSCFDSVFQKEKILSDVYDEVNKKFFSSTCLDTNYSSVLNQNYRLSNTISTISSIESNKIEISSDIASHSEGELYVPSSGSYSIGEVRILTKKPADGENANNFHDNTSIFVTKKMLTSWNESSMSLVQSMGEI
ncbi:uncharacterized protein LOC143424879 [Xylocopa sonorina]|uniref:uncharacterized protein LOC143424879 n=1 Tax=Xylocopa sonorina TaxID=1818115 RepID=UPI00403B33BD